MAWRLAPGDCVAIGRLVAAPDYRDQPLAFLYRVDLDSATTGAAVSAFHGSDGDAHGLLVSGILLR